MPANILSRAALPHFTKTHSISQKVVGATKNFFKIF